FVDAIVLDGIDMGRPCCGVRHCTVELLSTQDHFCPKHAAYGRCCVVTGCEREHGEGFRTCDDPVHRSTEEWWRLHGKGMFTLRKRLQRMHVSHPTDAISPDAPVDEVIEVEIFEGDSNPPGNRSMKTMFGRRRTHNEELGTRPCGMVLFRETFYGSETTPQVLDLLRKKFPMRGSQPRFGFYDSACGLYDHSRASGDTLYLEMGLPVDVFHWKCKHKKSTTTCSVHCNPYNYPELICIDGKTWYFNSSIAEQTNVWFGGYHAIIREMGSVMFDFFLDEMILQKNILTRQKLEAEGCLPGYRVYA
ncbi:hypothetical protein K466DRAFT_508146, partial [Polyporus arcularius HHB13444]